MITPELQVAMRYGVGHQESPSCCTAPLLSLQVVGFRGVGGSVVGNCVGASGGGVGSGL